MALAIGAAPLFDQSPHLSGTANSPQVNIGYREYNCISGPQFMIMLFEPIPLHSSLPGVSLPSGSHNVGALRPR
ncbi:MAG: hypothetical protein ACREYC_11305, partial [Gammaproteobacteria bacterium]